jgi:hypothetical protein
MSQIMIIGAPLCGKSTYAKTLGLPVFCTDPASTVRERHSDVTYMPDGISWEAQSKQIINWMLKNGDWCIEGVAAVRALRKWNQLFPGVPPCDKIISFSEAHPAMKRTIGQEAMAKGHETIWNEVKESFKNITEIKSWQQQQN